jgi:UDP-glucose 4-epimerase
MILVTGATGYVGKSFIEKYSDTYNIQTFSLQKSQLDTLDLTNVKIILHLAALVHQMHGAEASEYERINVKYTIDLAQKAKDAGVEQFIFMSSIAVYGEGETLLKENTSCSPVSEYGKSKLIAEQELEKLTSDSFVISIIRPPMIYGYNAPGNIKSLINILKKIPILPLGGINNQRSFIYIENLTSMIDKIILLQKGGVFLATDDRSISTTELILLLLKNMNKMVYLIKVPYFSNILKYFNLKIYNRLYGDLIIDNTLTKNNLNFNNLYTIEKALQLTTKRKKDDKII